LIPHVTDIDQDRFASFEKRIEIPVNTLNRIEAAARQLGPAVPAPLISALSTEISTAVRDALDVSLNSTCWKVAPMVGELSERIGKKVEFKVRGAKLNLPRKMVFDLRDALVHLVRNSLDHGIETPEERTQNQKDPCGHIDVEVVAANGSGEFEIILRDDGKGIDVDRVVKKAITVGLLKPEQAEKMNEEEKLNLIYLPNLSTKDVATDLSGRGVGMDVVKVIVSQWGGRVQARTTLGKGTEFHLYLKRGVVAEPSPVADFRIGA
jgi:two-component system chemotaxis sensor kinase CheA